MQVKKNETENIWRTVFSILWKILHDKQLIEKADMIQKAGDAVKCLSYNSL